MKLTLLIVAIVVLGAMVAILKVKLAGGAKTGVYFLRKSLFTPAELSFLHVLDAAVPGNVRVFGKVRLEDIVGVKSGLERGERQGARNRISRKHVDFLLVRATDSAPLAGIELDDSSHDEEARQERDDFVDAVFSSAELPLLHVRVQRTYDPSEIRAKVSKLINST